MALIEAFHDYIEASIMRESSEVMHWRYSGRDCLMRNCKCTFPSLDCCFAILFARSPLTGTIEVVAAVRAKRIGAGLWSRIRGSGWHFKP